MIFKASQPADDFPDKSVHQLLFEREVPNKGTIDDQERPCFINAENTNEKMSFGELKRTALKFGAGMRLIFPDFKRGDVVAIYSPNDLNLIPIFHGIVAIGGIVCPIDHKSNAQTVADCMKLVGAKIILAHPETINTGIEAAKIAKVTTENVFVLSQVNSGAARSIYKTFLDHDELATPESYSTEELRSTTCYLIFTSGTTGKKRAIRFTQQSLGYSLIRKRDSGGYILPTMSMLSHTDFHHASSLFMVLHWSVFFGCTTYIMRNHKPLNEMLLAIQNCRINVVTTPAWIAAQIMKTPNIEQYDLSSVKMILAFGSAMRKETRQLFYERFQIPILNHYGMTEAIMGCFIPSAMAGEADELAPGYSCKLIDNDGKELSHNEIGELCIRGPNIVINCYYNNDEENRESFDQDGFLHTGDLFQASETGLFKFIDRKADLIRYKHRYVQPQEVESTLLLHNLVKDCAVVGVYSNEESTWYPRAFVSLTEKAATQDRNAVHDEIIKFAETNLSDEKQLRGGLFIVQNVPRNSTGKIERRILRQADVVLEEWLQSNRMI